MHEGSPSRPRCCKNGPRVLLRRTWTTSAWLRAGRAANAFPLASICWRPAACLPRLNTDRKEPGTRSRQGLTRLFALSKAWRLEASPGGVPGRANTSQCPSIGGGSSSPAAEPVAAATPDLQGAAAPGALDAPAPAAMQRGLRRGFGGPSANHGLGVPRREAEQTATWLLLQPSDSTTTPDSRQPRRANPPCHGGLKLRTSLVARRMQGERLPLKARGKQALPSSFRHSLRFVRLRPAHLHRRVRSQPLTGPRSPQPNQSAQGQQPRIRMPTGAQASLEAVPAARR